MRIHLAYFDLIGTKNLMQHESFKEIFKNYILAAKMWIENKLWANDLRESYLDTIDGGKKIPSIKIRIISDSLLLIMESNNTTEVFYELVFSLNDYMLKRHYQQYCIIAKGEDLDYADDITFMNKTINIHNESLFEIIINPSILWSNIHKADHLVHSTKAWHQKYFLYCIDDNFDNQSKIEIADKKDFKNIFGNKLTCSALKRI